MLYMLLLNWIYKFETSFHACRTPSLDEKLWVVSFRVRDVLEVKMEGLINESRITSMHLTVAIKLPSPTLLFWSQTQGSSGVSMMRFVSATGRAYGYPMKGPPRNPTLLFDGC